MKIRRCFGNDTDAAEAELVIKNELKKLKGKGDNYKYEHLYTLLRLMLGAEVCIVKPFNNGRYIYPPYIETDKADDYVVLPFGSLMSDWHTMCSLLPMKKGRLFGVKGAKGACSITNFCGYYAIPRSVPNNHELVIQSFVNAAFKGQLIYYDRGVPHNFKCVIRRDFDEHLYPIRDIQGS